MKFFIKVQKLLTEDRKHVHVRALYILAFKQMFRPENNNNNKSNLHKLACKRKKTTASTNSKHNAYCVLKVYMLYF